MMQIDNNLTAQDLAPATRRLFDLALPKILALDTRWNSVKGTPVFTAAGQYTTRGWTEWTQGFQYGCGLLVFDATGERQLLDRMRARIVERMAPHITHRGVHDHGFNNISTYGTLRSLMREGRIPQNDWEQNFYEMALKASGAVQAARWAPPGYIYSFNGRHSLFVDTIRTLRILAVAHQLGHVLMEEGDTRTSLLLRADSARPEHRIRIQSLLWQGTRSVRFARKARVAPATKQSSIQAPGISAVPAPSRVIRHSRRGRGLAWAMLGFAEQLENISRPCRTTTLHR